MLGQADLPRSEHHGRLSEAWNLVVDHFPKRACRGISPQADALSYSTLGRPAGSSFKDWRFIFESQRFQAPASGCQCIHRSLLSTFRFWIGEIGWSSPQASLLGTAAGPEEVRKQIFCCTGGAWTACQKRYRAGTSSSQWVVHFVSPAWGAAVATEGLNVDSPRSYPNRFAISSSLCSMCRFQA